MRRDEELPEGIDATSSYPSSRDRKRWIPRLLLTMLLGFILLGVSNTFGQTTTTTRAVAPQATLVVTAPETLRGGLLYQVLVQVAATMYIRQARVVLSAGWFSGLTTNAEVPQPSTQQSIDGSTAFSLGAILPRHHKDLRIYFQVNPTTLAWNRSQNVELYDGTHQLTKILRSITVYP
jgi:hypothetical protein